MTFDEIADELGLTVKEVKLIYKSAIRKLKKDKKFHKLLKLYVEPEINWHESKVE
jgi:DNA-directed RNA polymerase sigma subunit (sigma70/sigma32)